MSKIKEILEKKGPHFNTVEPSTPVLDALTIMQSASIAVMRPTHARLRADQAGSLPRSATV